MTASHPGGRATGPASGPADLVVRGRIATLGGGRGLGWVEAVGISGGRVVAAGSVAEVGRLAGPRTRTIALEPGEVAIPGLTDAHLHLAEAALATEHVELTGAATVADGLAAIAAAHAALRDPEAWVEGAGWDRDRWGGWPFAADLERAAPGRRVALWAHDHHAIWASPAALAAAGINAATPDPPGGRIRRGPDGEAEGVLHETAAGLVANRVPPPTAERLERLVERTARDLAALGVVAVHDPGRTSFDPWSISHAVYAALADAGRLAIRVHAGFRPEGFPAVRDAGRRSGDALGAGPDSQARVGWQKLFADGTLGSRTAAMLKPFEPEPDAPLPAGAERGLWVTDPEVLAEHVRAAAAAGVATKIHAIGDRAVRVALDLLGPTAGRVPLMPRIEHVQLCDPADRARFAELGIAASVQPVHLRSDAAKARLLWGTRAESAGYAWASLVTTGAVVAFGTDAPVEPIDPWPGLAIAVTRTSTAWPAGTPPYGPSEAVSLDRALRAACIDPAISAAEPDRGRLVAGQRASLVVLPAAALDEPVEPGGALATARPRLVIVDGEVAFER